MWTMLGGVTGLPYTSFSFSAGLAEAEKTGPRLAAGLAAVAPLAAAAPDAAGLALAEAAGLALADAAPEAAGLALAATLADAAEAGFAALAGALLAGAAPPPQADSSSTPMRPRAVESDFAVLNMSHIVLHHGKQS